jgi:hypothetical protein
MMQDVDEASAWGSVPSAPAAPRRESLQFGNCPAADLLLEAKCYGMSNRRSDLRALGERVALGAHVEPQQLRETSPSRHGRDRFSVWRAPVRFAQARMRFLILSILR